MAHVPSVEFELPRMQQQIDALQRAVEELTVLNEITRQIGALADLGEVLTRIVERSTAAVDAEEGVISLVGEEKDDPARTLIRSMTTGVRRGPYHLDEHVVGWMQLYRKPLRVDDAANDGRFRLASAETHLRSLLSVPLLVRSRLIGVLTVCNRRDGGAFSDEDQRLLTIIAGQSAQIIENARLHEEERALLHLQEELRTAFRIQTGLLPDRAPEVEGYDLAGRSIPAQQVGGDFFDYIPGAGGGTVVCVGDVSGKGLPAALLMASAQAIVRGQAGVHRPPAETVCHINREFYRNVRRGSFLTLVYGELRSRDHLFRCVNAGHNRPLLVRKNGESLELERTGIAVGLAPRAGYETRDIHLRPGDVLFIYSDGVTEAMNTAREQFGEERLLQVLTRSAGLSADRLVEAVVDEVSAFAGAAPVSDDITVLAVIRRD
jgi:phosphoserine phosphatase RsbU/P